MQLEELNSDYLNEISLDTKIRYLKDKHVKVYKDVETKRFYEGDGRIERVLKQLSTNLFLVDCCFEDSYFSTVIDSEDILDY